MKGRDHRSTRWFWLDNRVLDDFMPKIQPTGLAIYTILARYANNNTATTFVSIEKIAEMIGCSRRTVERYIAGLERLKLIGRTSGKAVGVPNEYVMLDLLGYDTRVAPTPVGGTTPVSQGYDTGRHPNKEEQDSYNNPQTPAPQPIGESPSPDPLWHWIIHTFHSIYEQQNKVPCPWNPRAFTVLKQLRGRTKRWTQDNFEKAFAHYFNSDDVNPADAPEYVFKILTRYAVGPLNERHLPKAKANGTSKSEQIAADVRDQVRRAVNKL